MRTSSHEVCPWSLNSRERESEGEMLRRDYGNYLRVEGVVGRYARVESAGGSPAPNSAAMHVACPLCWLMKKSWRAITVD